MRETATIENYCIDCKQVAQPDCEQRGHIVGTLGHVNEQLPQKVEGVVLQRGQIGWQVERLPIHGCRIVDNTGRVVAADVYGEELAEQIVTEHNSHAALLAERKRLRAALTAVRNWWRNESVNENDLERQFPLSEIDAALATGEQGEEKR